MRIRCTLAALAPLLLLGCSSAPKGEVRSFPGVKVPSVVKDPAEARSYLLENFWGPFTAIEEGKNLLCDSTHVEGVSVEDVESQVGIFSTLLLEESPSESATATGKAFERFSHVQEERPQSNMLEQMTALFSKYLYDPNSPVRNEDAYGEFARRLSESPLVDKDLRRSYEFDARMCSLNATATPATDFSFTDRWGREHTLYEVKAPRTLLFFSNPGCSDCARITRELGSTQNIKSMIQEGKLALVNVYIDDDLDAWFSYVGEYPEEWICGYDPAGAIRGERSYNVRAIPSLYLLDENKVVILKDAPIERIMKALLSLK